MAVSYSGVLHRLPIKGKQIIYVRGGNEENLKSRFVKAAKLFRGGMARKIMVFIQPGITAFDQTLGRNLTNEEWASKQLVQLEIPEQDFFFADFEEGFLGTLTESWNLLGYVKQHGYVHVHIVTSTYHTQRTWLTFFTLLHDNPISFSVHDAGDVGNIGYLIKEYGKLLFYEIIFLPLYAFVS